MIVIEKKSNVKYKPIPRERATSRCWTNEQMQDTIKVLRAEGFTVNTDNAHNYIVLARDQEILRAMRFDRNKRYLVRYIDDLFVNKGVA